jgi:hypothetical protein
LLLHIVKLIKLGSYDYELSILNKKNKNTYINIIRKQKVLNSRNKTEDKYGRILNNSNLSDTLSNSKNKYTYQHKRLNASFDERLNNSMNSNNSQSRIEKEMQQKVKTIIKKDLVSRFRKSPYLKNFEKL